MTIPRSLPTWFLLLSVAFHLPLRAHAAATDNPALAVAAEREAIDHAYAAERSGRDAVADTHLASAGKGEWAGNRTGMLLARRTAAVCGLLRNAGEYVRAEQLATRVIRQLAKLAEQNDADRAERLFWEAWMEAEVLAHQERALSLLKTAEKLAPEDGRVIELELRLVTAATPWPDTGATP